MTAAPSPNEPRNQMMDPAKRCQRRIGGVSALLLCCLSFLSCVRREPATAAKRDLAKEDLAVYRKTMTDPVGTRNCSDFTSSWPGRR